MNTSYMAVLTARGEESCVPDNAGAVDALVFLDGVEVGEVTLVPDYECNGAQLTTWGSPDHWASSQLIEHLWDLDGDDRRDAIQNIVAAVRTAEGVMQLKSSTDGLFLLDAEDGHSRWRPSAAAHTRDSLWRAFVKNEGAWHS